MITITQKRIKNHNVYYRTTTDSAGIPIRHEPFDCRISYETKNGKKIIVLLDRDGNVRPDAYQYLNNDCEMKKFSTRVQMALAINLFHIFCDITGYNPKMLTTPQLKQLVMFLLGFSVKSQDGSTVSTRSPKTASGYYSFIKDYLYAREWSTQAFEQRKSYTLETTIGDITFQRKCFRDPNRPKVDSFERHITPKHLNLEQSRALVSNIRESNNKTLMLLVRLQIGYRLRCGEALGITYEDIKMRRNTQTGEIRYCIILRNRCSDRKDQHCKGLYQPFSADEYSQKAYKDSRRWEIDICQELYEELMTYFDETRNKRMTAERRKRMEEDTLADSVERSGKATIASKKNWYLFVGRNGRRMSSFTYNYQLKKHFEAIGIMPDKGAKFTNCSHKLRHTFAMILTTYGTEKVTREQLRDLMRHLSVYSSEPYYTPTQEETIKMKEAFIESIHDLIPELNGKKTK